MTGQRHDALADIDIDTSQVVGEQVLLISAAVVELSSDFGVILFHNAESPHQPAHGPAEERGAEP
jgi:hypothetical protein